MNNHTKSLLTGATGSFLFSFDVIFIKGSQVGLWHVLLYASLSAVIFLLSYCYYKSPTRDAVGYIYHQIGKYPYYCMGIVALSAIGNMIFVLSLFYTNASNTIFILSTAPFFGAIGGWLLLSEKTPLRVWLSAGIAISGIFFIMYGGILQGFLIGDLLALGTVLCIAGIHTLFRFKPHADPMVGFLFTYVFIGIIAFVMLSLYSEESMMIAAFPMLLLLLMGIAQNLSKLLLKIASKHLIVSELSFLILIEVIFASVWLWLFLQETIPTTTLLGGLIIFIAIINNAYFGYKQHKLKQS